MATLKERSQKTLRDYYVTADVRGTSVTLRCSSASEELYRKLGFSPGDELPERVTWKLYEMGLHGIEETRLDEEEVDSHAESRVSRDADDRELSDERLRGIHKFVAERFPDVGNVIELGDVYGYSIPKRFRTNKRGMARRLDDTVFEAVGQWEIFEQEKLIARDSGLQERLCQMYEHPRGVSGVMTGESVLYELDCTDLPVSSFALYDHRRNDDLDLIADADEVPEPVEGVDFQVGFVTDRETHRFSIRNGMVINWSFGDSSDGLDEVDDDIQEGPDRYRHGLTEERNQLRGILGEFFDEHDSYSLSDAGLESRLDSYSATVTGRGAPSFEERAKEKHLLWIEKEDGLLLVETGSGSYAGTIISEDEVESDRAGEIRVEIETTVELEHETQELIVSTNSVGTIDGFGSSDIPLTDKVYARLKELIEAQ